MATERQVSLKITTESDGGQSIKALVAQLQQLAAQGGDAAPELKRLADEIQQLDQAREAANSLIVLRNATSELGATLLDAEMKAAQLVPQLDAAKNESNKFSAAQTNAVRELDQSKARVDELKAALNLLKGEIKDAGGRTVELAQRENELKAALKQSQEAVKDKRAALTAANAELKQALNAEKALATEIADTEKTVKRLNDTLTKEQQALIASAQAAKTAGVDVGKLASEQTRLQSAMAGTVAAAGQQAQALQAADARAVALAQQAQQTANALQNAFATVGVRSAQEIRAEIARVEAAVQLLTKSAGSSGTEVARAMSAGKERIAALNAELRASHEPIQKTGLLASGLAKGFGALAAVTSALEIGRQFITANVELQRNERALRAVTGSAAAARTEMNFIRQTADRLGVSVNDLAEQYRSLLAASKGTALEGAGVREVFTSVSNAMGQLGASSYSTSRAFTAITQMVSKGVVSMEELRQQLGEALPGAMQAAAKGLGITEAKLMELVSSGGVLTEHFLPALKKGLDQTFTQGGQRVEGFEQTWNRFKQTLTDTSTFVGQSGVMSGLATTLEYVGASVRFVSASFELLGKTVGITLGFIATFDWTHPIESVKTWGKTVAETATEISDRLDAANGRTKKVAEGYDAAGAAAQRASNQMAAAAEGPLTLAKAQDLVTNSANLSAEAHINAAEAAMQASNSNTSAIPGWTKINSVYAEAITRAERFTKASELLAEAKKQEGDAAVKLATVSGGEAAQRQAALSAAEAYSAAIGRVAASRNTEAVLLERQIVSLQAEAAARGGLSKNEAEAVKKLQEALVLKEAEVRKSQEMAEAAAAEALQNRMLAQTYLDNAARMGEYRQSMEAAVEALRRLEQMQALGLATEEQVKKARVDAAVSIGLYSDAINDNIAAKKREGELSVEISQLAGNETEARNVAAQAAANNATAVSVLSETRQREVAALQEQIARLELYRQTVGTLTPALQAQMDQLRQSLTLKQEELAVSERATAAARLEAETARIRAETYKDNSAKIYEYKAAMDAAKASLDDLNTRHAAGKATEAEVIEGRTKLAGATALYRDALHDAAAAADRQIASLERQASVTSASLQLEMEIARTAEKVALAHGDERAAIAAKVAQKQIEIRIAQANLELAGAEARAILAKAEADRKEAEASGTLTAEKKAEIEARIAAAKVKQLESERGAELIKQLELEVAAIRNVANAKKDSSGKSSGSSSGSSGRGDTSNGFSGNNDRVAQIDFAGAMYAQGASIDEVKNATQYVNEMLKQMLAQNPFQGGEVSQYAAYIKHYSQMAIDAALRRARDEMVASRTSSSGSVGTSQGSLLNENPLSRPAATGAQVTINIGNQSHNLNVASRADASTLEAVLRQLNDSSKRF